MTENLILSKENLKNVCLIMIKDKVCIRFYKMWPISSCSCSWSKNADWKQATWQFSSSSLLFISLQVQFSSGFLQHIKIFNVSKICNATHKSVVVFFLTVRLTLSQWFSWKATCNSCNIKSEKMFCFNSRSCL